MFQNYNLCRFLVGESTTPTFFQVSVLLLLICKVEIANDGMNSVMLWLSVEEMRKKIIKRLSLHF